MLSRTRVGAVKAIHCLQTQAHFRVHSGIADIVTVQDIEKRKSFYNHRQWIMLSAKDLQLASDAKADRESSVLYK